MGITPGGREGDASGFGKPGSPRGLTDDIRMVVHALLRKNPQWTLSHAIAVARSQSGKWTAKSKNPAVRAGYGATLVEQSKLDHRKRGASLANPGEDGSLIVSAGDGPSISYRTKGNRGMSPAAKRALVKRMAKKRR